jgi:hypothetical protein
VEQDIGIGYYDSFSARFSSVNFCGNYNQYLITPQLVTTTDRRSFTFYYSAAWCEWTETFRVGWSSTGNDVNTDFTWSEDYTWSNFGWGYYSKNDLPLETKYVAINYKSHRQAYLYVDYVQGPWLYHPCAEPDSLLTYHIMPFTAMLSWSDSTTQRISQIELGPSGFTPLGMPTVSGINSSPYEYNYLMPDSTYDWYVRAECYYPNFSDWSGPVSFTTPGLIDTYPFSESFESGFGSWYQGVLDDFDWVCNSGGTGSSGTGPDTAQDGSYYAYIEASAPNYPYKQSILQAYYDFSGINWPQFEFYYHMLGESMGNLYLIVSEKAIDSIADTVWSASGNQGSEWHKATVPLGYYSNDSVEIKFDGVTGDNWSSDIAIDNILIVDQVDPILTPIPDTIDYGECPLNNISMDYYTKSIFIRNIGPGTITVSDAFLTGGDISSFQLVDANTYPIGVSWPDTLEIKILFDPVSIGTKSTTLRVVTSSDGNQDIHLSGSAYVGPAQNLSAISTVDFSIDLDWDPPLPENELRYDNGIITNWYWVGTPSSNQHYFYTRFTSPVSGTLDHVSLFTRSDSAGTNWNQILVCPADGNGNPDLSSPIETYNSVVVSSISGEWLLLPLSIPESITEGTDFYVVTR